MKKTFIPPSHKRILSNILDVACVIFILGSLMCMGTYFNSTSILTASQAFNEVTIPCLEVFIGAACVLGFGIPGISVTYMSDAWEKQRRH